ncbi:hypothetical protein [Streptomyces sp. BK205]|uniref:hypothetical protein n=1 Tax=Streptomyces sp. BK205 TaxID=2512164 RepID=UPI001043516F|nr:hypothetical protein [Streptomyces sp. BK205]
MAGLDIAIISSGGAVLGALIGGGVTGIFALRNAKLQVNTQRETAEKDRSDRQAEREEERSAHHREIRRQAYVGFLENFDVVSRGLTALDTMSTRQAASPSCQVPASVEQALGELSRSLYVVTMEGPSSIAARSTEMMNSTRSQFIAQMQLIASNPNTDDTVQQLGGSSLDALRIARQAASARFIELAREVLSSASE